MNIPPEILDAPILHDAILLNAARCYGVQVLGLDTESDIEPVATKASDLARERLMVKYIRELVTKGYNVTALIGQSHFDALHARTRGTG